MEKKPQQQQNKNPMQQEKKFGQTTQKQNPAPNKNPSAKPNHK